MTDSAPELLRVGPRTGAIGARVAVALALVYLVWGSTYLARSRRTAPATVVFAMALILAGVTLVAFRRLPR